MPNLERSTERPREEMSTSSIHMRPALSSIRRNSVNTNVDLPAPVLPTINSIRQIEKRLAQEYSLRELESRTDANLLSGFRDKAQIANDGFPIRFVACLNVIESDLAFLRPVFGNFDSYYKEYDEIDPMKKNTVRGSPLNISASDSRFVE